jgi:hypothetical protein
MLTISIVSCGIFPNNTQDKAIATAIAMTVEAMKPQNTQSILLPTNTSVPQATATLIPTSTPVIVPSSTPRNCNMATFISETPLDGASFKPGETFTKSWRLKNTGTCTWNGNYRTIYYSGDGISGAGTKYLNSSVAPGEKVDIVYTFKAPSTPGTYKTLFKLQDDDGVSFAQFWVQFKVKSTSPTSTPSTFAVTSVNFSSSDAIKSGTCPQTFDYQAFITTNKAGTVSYHWEFSDGSSSSVQTLTYSSAGSKTVSGTWALNATGDYWVKLYIDEPNHQLFGTLDLSLTCTPAFAVTGVDFSAPTSPYTAGDCSPLALNYQIDVAANGAGTVTYTITFSDSTSVSDSLAFSSAGTQSITGTWDVGNVVGGTYWFNIYIDNPNHQLFGPHSIDVTCP